MRSEAGLFLTDCLSLGRGEKPASEVRSLVYLHNNAPKFTENIYVTLKPEQVGVCHLYFELRKATRYAHAHFISLALFFAAFIPPSSRFYLQLSLFCSTFAVCCIASRLGRLA